MGFEVLERGKVAVLERVTPLERASDALDLIGACMEHRSSRVLVEAHNFAPAFFDLGTGLAGELLQKLANYHVRLAGVFPSQEGYTERFREFLLEAKRGHNFRVFTSRGDAEAWLIADGGME